MSLMNVNNLELTPLKNPVCLMTIDPRRTSKGGLSIGISPALSLDEYVHKYHSPVDVFDVLIYTGSGLTWQRHAPAHH